MLKVNAADSNAVGGDCHYRARRLSVENRESFAHYLDRFADDDGRLSVHTGLDEYPVVRTRRGDCCRDRADAPGRRDGDCLLRGCGSANKQERDKNR